MIYHTQIDIDQRYGKKDSFVYIWMWAVQFYHETRLISIMSKPIEIVVVVVVFVVVVRLFFFVFVQKR